MNARHHLQPLLDGNARFQRAGRTSFEAQRPKFVVDNCGLLDPVIIHRQGELGALFDVSSRGLHAPDQHLASIWFALTQMSPAPRLLEVLVHHCVRGGLCRVPFPSDSASEPRDLLNSRWKDGVHVIDLPCRSSLPQGDVILARVNSIKILNYSSDIHAMVADGRLLVAEAWYDNDTGHVHYPAFLTSADAARGVPERALAAAVDPGRQAGPAHAHPALEALAELVRGNAIHVRQFAPPALTEFVVFGCADSRTSPSIVFDAEHGRIEVVRNAGNAVNRTVLGSLRISVEESLRRRDFVTLVVLAHTRCGAVAAALSSAGTSSPVDAGALPIVRSLEHRFVQYRTAHPDFRMSDPQLIEAARHNAIGAAHDVARMDGPDAEWLRDTLRRGHLQIVPARYLLKSGSVEFFDPVGVPDA